MENKKKFELPKAVLVNFYDEDIILTSGGTGNPDYGDDPQDEWEW